MKFVDYVQTLSRPVSRHKNPESNRKKSYKTLNNLHGEAFYCAFDKAFRLKPVVPSAQSINRIEALKEV